MPLSANCYSAPLDILVDNHVRISGHLYEVDMTRPEAISCKIVGGNIFERFIDYIYQRGWMKRPEEFIAQLHEFVANHDTIKSDVKYACDFFTGITGEMNGIQSSEDMLDDNVKMGCKLVKPTDCFNQVIGRLISNLGNPELPCSSEAPRELTGSKIATSNYLGTVGRIHHLQERRNSILDASIRNNMDNWGAHQLITTKVDENGMPAILCRECPEDLGSPQHITDRLWQYNDSTFDFIKAETTSAELYSNGLSSGRLGEISRDILGSRGSGTCEAFSAMKGCRDKDLKEELINSCFLLKKAVLNLENSLQDIEAVYRDHIALIEKTIITIEARNHAYEAVEKIMDCNDRITNWLYGGKQNEVNNLKASITAIADIAKYNKKPGVEISTILPQPTIENIVMLNKCNDLLMEMIYIADDNGYYDGYINEFREIYNNKHELNEWKQYTGRMLIDEWSRGQEAVDKAINLNKKVDKLINFADEKMSQRIRKESKSTKVVPSMADINVVQGEIKLMLETKQIIRNMQYV